MAAERSVGTRGGGLSAWIVFAGLSALWLAQTKDGPQSWPELSRLAAIESLVERGTHAIDGSALAAATFDRVRIRGRYYCDKPPLLQLLGALPYKVLHDALGARIQDGGCGADEVCAYRWLTFLLVGLPSAAGCALLFLLALRRTRSVAAAAGITGLLAFGTMVWPYSLVLNNHMPAAAALLGAFVLAAGGPSGASRARMAAAGLLAGLAVAFDLLAAFPAAALGVRVALGRRGLSAFAAGCALPLAATMVADVQISGSVLPPYFAPHGYRYPGSPFLDTVGAQAGPDDLARYVFRGLAGDRGLLAYSPILLWALAGLARTARERHHELRGSAVAAAAGMAAYAAYVFTRTYDFGGKAYGQRYFLAIVPLLAAFAPCGGLPRRGLRRGAWALALAVAAALSLASAWQGVRRTWTLTPPALYLDARWPPLLTGICSSFSKSEDPCLRLRPLRRRDRASAQGIKVPSASR